MAFGFASTLLFGLSFARPSPPAVQGADSFLRIEYEQEAGPRVVGPGREFVLADFVLDGKRLMWPFDAAIESIPPAPSRPGVGFRLTANAFEQGGRACQVRITAQAATVIVEVRGLAAERVLTVGFGLRTSSSDYGMRAPYVEAFEPPVLQMAVGDPDAGYNRVYDPMTDRMFQLVPPPLARVGPASVDGTRRVLWKVTSSAAGEVNGLVVEVENGHAAGAWKFPERAPAGVRPRPPRAGWRASRSLHSYAAASDLVEEARQVRDKLLPFGMTHVLLDDGWRLPPESRPAGPSLAPDPERFPEGLEPVLAALQTMGLTPGLTLVPEEASAREDAPGILTNPKGSPYGLPASGARLWNLRDSAGRNAIQEVVKAAVGVGAEHVVFDAQWEVLESYRNCLRTGESRIELDERFRDLLGDSRALLRQGVLGVAQFGLAHGTPPRVFTLAVGIADSIQAFDDRRDPAWNYRKGVAAAGLGARFQGWAFAGDPGAVRAGESTPIETLQAWASLVALTGQDLNIREKPSSLPEERLEVLRRTIGGPAIRAVQVPKECVTPRRVRLWNARDGEVCLVSGYFSFDAREDAVPSDVEGPLASEMAGAEKFDFWGNRFLGTTDLDGPVGSPHVEEGRCLVVSARRAKGVPQVIATSRHVTQAALDLTEERFDPASLTLSGASKLIAGDPYEIRIAVPDVRWQVRSASVDGLECSVAQESRLVRVRMRSADARTARWKVAFGMKDDLTKAPVPEVVALRASNGGGIAVRLTWSDERSRTGLFIVKRDGLQIGVAAGPSFLDVDGRLHFGSAYTYEVVPIGDRGEQGKPSSIQYTHVQPPRTPLTQLGYQARRLASPRVVEDYSAALTDLSVRGELHSTGLGLTTPVTLDVPLRGAAGTLIAGLGIDDAAQGRGSAVITVRLDGRPVVTTPVLRGTSEKHELRVPIPSGVNVLTFEVDGTADGSDHDLVDVLSPEIRLLRKD